MKLNKEYEAYCTYIAYEKAKDVITKLKEYNITIVPTHYIYMNMMGGWTEEQCDDVIYIVEKEKTEWKADHLTLRLKF